jgi:agmatinase
MIKLIGIPFDANSSFLKGASLAPPRIRLMDKDGSANGFAENGIEIIEGEIYQDAGDIVFETSSPDAAFNLIKNTIGKELQNNNKICCFGGDHSISFPVIDAFTDVYSNLHVLHLDAHADLYENFDDNPYSHASPFARLLEKGKLKSLTQVGIRTLNTHQRQQAAKYGVNVVEMKDFSYSFIASLASPLYVSIDLDVLDPAFAPGISHHEPGGISTRELITILQKINANIVGGDIVEYNPTRDINNMTAMVAYKIFKELVVKMMPQQYI